MLAARRGDDSLELAERRLGAMRIATKYPRTAERHFEQSGRQAEVIEVKGSVELAPLVGLADGIVDLVDTGRTLEENELEVREEISTCTARLIANRVAHKLRAGRDRRARAAAAGGVAMKIERVEWDGADAERDGGARARPGPAAGGGDRAGRRGDRGGSQARRPGREVALAAVRRTPVENLRVDPG